MNIGEHIKQFRKMQGLSQKELAEKSGISLMSIRRYETGEREPRHDVLERIANALEAPILFFYGIREFREEQIPQSNECDEIYPDRKYREIESLLSRSYKNIELKLIAGYDWFTQYYLISEEDGSKFILYDNDIEALYNATMAYLPAIIARLKDIRTEKEVISELEEWRASGKEVRATMYRMPPLEERLFDSDDDIAAPQDTPTPPEGKDTTPATEAPEEPQEPSEED